MKRTNIKELIMKRLTLFVLPMLLLGLFLPSPSQGATSGKVTGIVTDAGTGDPLPGANVVIDGTRRGATTDVEGRFVILAVDPGVYAITATMVGYGIEKRQNVNVIADYTSTVDFSLKESTLEMAELVVTAERPPVEPDKTTSKYVISSADIEAVP
jgi:hypothetical protein